MSWAEETFRDLLSRSGVEEKTAYTPAEVAAILRLSVPTVKLYCRAWEPPGAHGRARRSIDSYSTPGGHRRISQKAIIEYLKINHTYEREMS